MTKPITQRAQVWEYAKTLAEPFTAHDLAQFSHPASILKSLEHQGLIKCVGKIKRQESIGGAKLKQYVRVERSEIVKAKIEKIREIAHDHVNLLAQHDKLPPRCTTWAQYDLWRSLRPAAGFGGFCEDCTPEYQAEMCKVGKCDHPEILFYFDKDGLIYGTQRIHESKKALTAKDRK